MRDFIPKKAEMQGPYRRGLIDRLLLAALRMVRFSPAIQVHILTLILHRERKKRGIR